MQISLCVYLQSHLEFSLKRTLICLDLFLPSLDLIWVNEWKSLSRVRLFMTPWVVHGILQARILEWGAFPFSKGSSQPRDQTQVSRIAADSLPNELSELFSRTARLLAICPKSSGCFMFLCFCYMWLPFGIPFPPLSFFSPIWHTLEFKGLSSRGFHEPPCLVRGPQSSVHSH